MTEVGNNSQRFWLNLLKAEFSLEAGRSQLLAYMLANSFPNKPTYGWLTNGGSFRFLKLLKTQGAAQYAVSRIFDLFNPGNDLVEVLKVLIRIIHIKNIHDFTRLTQNVNNFKYWLIKIFQNFFHILI